MGCGAEDPVPAVPTWFADVQPILQGNCFHCHGDNHTKAGTASRFDVYDPADPAYSEFTVSIGGIESRATDGIIGAKVMSATFMGLVGATKVNERMPPPPASGLSARDQQVLKVWAKTKTRGKRLVNQKPTALFAAEPKDAESDGLFVVSLDINDGDGDQVLGKVTVAGVDALITRSGRNTFKFPSTGGAGAPVTVVLYDGQDRVVRKPTWSTR